MEKHIILNSEGNICLTEDSLKALREKLLKYGLTIEGNQVMSLATLPFSQTKYIYKIQIDNNS